MSEEKEEMVSDPISDSSLPVSDDYSAQLAEYEELFSTRYTDEDESYMANLNKSLDPPPTVKNWYSKPRKQYDYTRGRGGGGGGRGYDRNEWRGGRGNYQHGYHGQQRHYDQQRHYGQQRHYDDQWSRDRDSRDRYRSNEHHTGGRHYSQQRQRGDRHHPYQRQNQYNSSEGT